MTSDVRPTDAPPAGRYQIDPAGSEIALSVRHLFGLATVRARMSISSGDIVVTADPSASEATVTASAASFDSGDARRDRAVTAAKFLDVERHPYMHFTSSAITRENGDWVVTGVLTAHGVDAPVRWVVGRIDCDDSALTIRATARADRHDHGITAARGLAGRSIDVRITARAVRRDPTD